MPNETDHTNTMPRPSHPGGCPCDGCNAERASLEASLAVLRAAGEIPPEAVGAD